MLATFYVMGAAFGWLVKQWGSISLRPYNYFAPRAASDGWLPVLLFIGAILLALLFLRFFLHLLGGLLRIGCLLLIGLGLLWFYLTYLR